MIICKVDINAAFRRGTLSSDTAAESLTIFDNMLRMALSMTFGGAPCPSLWGVISETLADITNMIPQNPHWDHLSLYDEISDSLEPPLSLPESTPFHPGKEMVVPTQMNDQGYFDIYIDDTIGVTPDLHNYPLRMCRATPLAIRTLARPLNTNDIIPEKDIIATKKYQVEGRLEEQKMILGWILNTRSLEISLPPNKHEKWTKEILRLISIPKVRGKHLEYILGSLNHVANIYNPMRHFLGRIYQALYRANSSKGWTSLKTTEIVDFHTIMLFLDSAKKGISMNNLTFRNHTHLPV